MDINTRKRRRRHRRAHPLPGRYRKPPPPRRTRTKNADQRLDAASQQGSAGFCDTDVCSLLRTRLPALDQTQTRVAGLAVVVVPGDESQARAERSTFCQTMHAVEAVDGAAPPDHVTRPPTVIWSLAEAGSLAALGHSPDAALVPPGLSGPPQSAHVANTEANRARQQQERSSAAKGPWYVPPDIRKVLQRGPKGYGCGHARPPVPRSSSASSWTKLLDRLTGAQRRVLEDQNVSVRTVPHRIRMAIRQLRRGMGAAFSVSAFMQALEEETGERLVHVSVVPDTASSPSSSPNLRGLLVVTLVHALDNGGRFFLCLRWSGVGKPPVPLGGSLDTPRWWADAVVYGRSALDMFCYACPCKVGPSSSSQDG